MGNCDQVDLREKQPEIDAVATAVGRFLANFSILERLANKWIGLMSTDEALAKIVCNNSLEQRLQAIRLLVESGRLPDEVSAEGLQLWANCSKLKEFRNRIAHGSIGIMKVSALAPPSAGVIYRCKRTGNQKLIGLSELVQKAIEASTLSIELEKLQESVLKERL